MPGVPRVTSGKFERVCIFWLLYVFIKSNKKKSCLWLWVVPRTSNIMLQFHINFINIFVVLWNSIIISCSQKLHWNILWSAYYSMWNNSITKLQYISWNVEGNICVKQYIIAQRSHSFPSTFSFNTLWNNVIWPCILSFLLFVII